MPSKLGNLLQFKGGSVTSLLNGNFVNAAVTSALNVTTTGTMFTQIFTANGTKVGPEIQTSTFLGEVVSSEGILATLNNGNYVVVWSSTGIDGNGIGVAAQIFTENGVSVGSPFQVNTYTSGDQSFPVVTGLKNGNFVVAWMSQGPAQDGSGYGIYAQIFTPDGIKVGNEFQMNTYITDEQWFPAIINLTNGNFVGIWSSNKQDGSGYGMYAQIFTPDGTKLGNEFQVNTYTLNDQVTDESTTIATALSNGNFVVTWSSNLQDGSGYGVYGQIFNPSGTKVGGEFQINTYTLSDQYHSSVNSLPNGNFVVAWQSYGQDGSGWAVFAQVFSADGTKLGNEFEVAAIGSDPSITTLQNGNFLIQNIDIGQIFYGQITANNFTQTIDYTNAITKPLPDIQVLGALNENTVTATLTLSDPTAGSLNTGASNNIISTYNPTTGVWQASGNINDVNTLLASLVFKPANNYNQNFAISISLNDGTSNTPLIRTLSLTNAYSPTTTNQPPKVINPIPDQITTVNTPFDLVVSNTFTDPDGDPLTLSAKTSDGKPLPGWINFDASNQKFLGTPTSVGTSKFSLFATDPANLTARADFSVVANPDPNPGNEASLIGGLVGGLGTLVLTGIATGIGIWKCYTGKDKKKDDQDANAKKPTNAKSTDVTVGHDSWDDDDNNTTQNNSSTPAPKGPKP